jgi:hypothetical protein
VPERWQLQSPAHRPETALFGFRPYTLTSGEQEQHSLL